MIEFQSKKPELSITLEGAVKVTLSAPQTKLKLLTDLTDKEYDISIKEHRNKRSTDANAYAWKLLTEIANEMRVSKEQIYEEMLGKYGQSETVSVLSSVDVSGYFKYYTIVGTAVLKNKEFTHYRVLKGSSEFDTKEMSIFLDGVIDEAKILGIDTRTPDEIAEIKALWKAE